MKKQLSIIMILSCPLFILTEWKHYSFDEAMHLDTPYEFNPDMQFDAQNMKKISDETRKDGDYDGVAFYEFCKNLYEKNNPTNIADQEQVKIPKIIHHIWLGTPLPLKFKPLIETWKMMHKDAGWIFKLWTDEDAELFGMYNKAFYDAAGTYYSVKSDIFLLEILYRHGGVYVDTDFECLTSFDELHKKYDFYTGLQPLICGYVQLGSGLIGSRAGHPIIKDAILAIQKNWHKQLIVAKTGPLAFSKSFFDCADKEDNIDIAFPSIYLYPASPYKKEGNYKLLHKQGSLAIHHWAASWVFSMDQVKLVSYND